MMAILVFWMVQEPVTTNVRCLECHADVGDREPAGSVHPAAEVSCIECHGSDEWFQPSSRGNPHGPEFRRRTHRVSISALCGACHRSELEPFLRGAHQRATLSAEGQVFMGCVQCHAYHGTRRADRREIWNACVRCHQPGSPEHGAGVEYLRETGRVEEGLKRLRGKVEDFGSRPGLLMKEEEALREESGRRLSEVAVLQHQADFASSAAALRSDANRIEAAYDTLEGRERAFGMRYAALAAFLALTGASAWLVGRKAARLRKEESR